MTFPFKYGKYFIQPAVAFIKGFEYVFAHEDYDGAPDAKDGRCGFGKSVEACQIQIDELEEDYVTVCGECGEEVNEHFSGDEGFSICSECGNIEGDNEQITVTEYEAR